jgi:hypothetical protein
MTFSGKCNVFRLLILTAIIAVLAACGTTPSPSGSDSEITRRQNTYMAHLRQEGYNPTIDEDGDITFKVNGRTYFIFVGKKDNAYFELLLPNIWSIKSDSERAKAAVAVSYANGTTKAAKAYISGSTDQWVSIALEMYLENPNDFKVLFSRMMKGIDTAEKDFASKM